MKIAAIQHRVRETAEEDVRALAEAAVAAAGRGAELIVLPDVASLLRGDGEGHALLATLMRDVSALCIVPSPDPDLRGVAIAAALPDSIASAVGGSGVAGFFVGDACMDAAEIARVAEQSPAFAVLSPRSDTDLQAESMLEFAIALSDSLAGVVVIAECSGAEPLEVGHGGSAIVVLGEVVTEALADDDVIIAEVLQPFPQPSPREPLPKVPPLLAQRVAHHTGHLPPEHGPDLS
jgi:hypothetical protein